MLYTYEEFSPQVPESAYIAPTAALIGRVKLGANASIWFHTVMRADINYIEVGEESNIQDGCLLHVTHELPVIIGKRVTLGHGAIVHAATVEDDCLIAMGAVVLDGAVIGKGSLVAAGAVVSPGTIIPPGSLVMGLPAKVARPARAEDRLRIEGSWQHYVEYSRIYQRQKI